MFSSANDSRAPRFLSLKWKVILLLSLVLIGVNAVFTILSTWSLRKQYQDARQTAIMRHVHLAQALFEQSSERLRQLASVLPDIENLPLALAAGDREQVRKIFDPHWSTIELELGLDRVIFFDRSGVAVAGWGGMMEMRPHLKARLSALAVQANTTERPQSYLDCGAICTNFAMVPLLVKGKPAGVVLTATSLAETVVTFKQISGADLGILVPSGAGEPRDRGYVASLQARAVALSDYSQSLEILNGVKDTTAAKLSNSLVYQVHFRNRVYELTRVPLSSKNQSGDGFFLMIFDITKDLAQIRREIWKDVAAGIGGLVASETLLLIMLWVPMRRLRRAADTIPLLGQGAFERVRAAMRPGGAARQVVDEIDLLDNTAARLADTLENLHRQSLAHNRQLSVLVDDLSRERDFATGLLNTAPALILTQGRDGRILSANGFAQDLAGCAEADWIGSEFVDHFEYGDEQKRTDARGELLWFISAGKGHLQQECVLRCGDGNLRHIVWFHSRLAARGPQDPALLSVGVDITELREAEQRASYLAEYDSLTGLLNRHRFQDRLQATLDGAGARGGEGALLCFDVDEFKYVNDTGGHQAGDALLRAVARELQQLAPQPVIASRLGGDDFAVAFFPMDAAEAIQVARQINQKLGGVELPAPWRQHKISVATGIVLFPEHGRNSRELLANADLALFQAKEKGRGSWHLYSADEQLMERVVKRVYWVERIEQALSEDRFELYYQPIYGIKEKAVSHYEVLVRLRHRDGAVATPGEFIGIAEATGLIRALDHLVLRKAIAKLAELSASDRATKLSVNLSGRSLSDPVLVDILKWELSQRQVDPSRLIFEITETAALEDFSAARNLIQTVQKLGCAFALDDFGVGFSSFQYLKELPVDYVKIDGSFIRNLAQNQDDQVFVRVLVDAARGFGKKTVAEFVESSQILALLEEYGVDYAQGYYVGKPDSVLNAGAFA